jgi:hypothetical protein
MESAHKYLGNGRPEPVVHGQMLETLVHLFETGFKTVTLSRQAVECFMRIRNTSLTTSLFAFSEAGVNTYNAIGSFRQISELNSQPIEFSDGLIDNAKKFFGFIDKTPGEIKTAALEAERASAVGQLHVQGVTAGLQAAYAVFKLANSACKAYTANQEKKKWTNGM